MTPQRTRQIREAFTWLMEREGCRDRLRNEGRVKVPIMGKPTPALPHDMPISTDPVIATVTFYAIPTRDPDAFDIRCGEGFSADGIRLERTQGEQKL